jgi:cyclopropane fatty-acyl-phospholipid synthase-like methyltransferase
MKDLIDIGQTLDLPKLKLYNEWLYTAHIYDEGDSDFHKQLTKRCVEQYIDPLNLPKDNKILDIGCGPGYFLDEMKERGYTDLTGVTLSLGDVTTCQNKGHTIKRYDISFIPQKDGYYDESVDFIFSRQALEHSPYPIFTLMEYNRILKQGSKMYLEVPAPDTNRRHEWNLNHYSVFGVQQLLALLNRTGFNVDKAETFEFDVLAPNEQGEPGKVELREKFICLVVTKARPLDIK